MVYEPGPERIERKKRRFPVDVPVAIDSYPEGLSELHTVKAAAAEQRGKDIAFRIRAELVCCEIYQRVNERHELTFEEALESSDWHDLCYWGEGAAQIAEGRCPGYETVPNVCQCPCEGCKYNCRAHELGAVDTSVAVPPGGNMEDCPRCTDPNPAYPWICPGHPTEAEPMKRETE